MKAVKVISYILLVCVMFYALYRLLYAAVVYAAGKITYDLSVTSVYLRSLKIDELVKKGETSLEVDCGININNPSTIAIKVKNIFVTIYYDGRRIAESYVPTTYKILARTKFNLAHKVKFFVNDKSTVLMLKLAVAALNKSEMPTIQYKVDYAVWFIKGSYSGESKIEF